MTFQKRGLTNHRHFVFFLGVNLIDSFEKIEPFLVQWYCAFFCLERCKAETPIIMRKNGTKILRRCPAREFFSGIGPNDMSLIHTKPAKKNK